MPDSNLPLFSRAQDGRVGASPKLLLGRLALLGIHAHSLGHAPARTPSDTSARVKSPRMKRDAGASGEQEDHG